MCDAASITEWAIVVVSVGGATMAVSAGLLCLIAIWKLI